MKKFFIILNLLFISNNYSADAANALESAGAVPASLAEECAMCGKRDMGPSEPFTLDSKHVPAQCPYGHAFHHKCFLATTMLVPIPVCAAPGCGVPVKVKFRRHPRTDKKHDVFVIGNNSQIKTFGLHWKHNKKEFSIINPGDAPDRCFFMQTKPPVEPDSWFCSTAGALRILKIARANGIDALNVLLAGLEKDGMNTSFSLDLFRSLRTNAHHPPDQASGINTFIGLLEEEVQKPREPVTQDEAIKMGVTQPGSKIWPVID